MGKKKIDKEIFKVLIEDYGIKDTNDIKDMLKDLMSGTIQTMLEAEIEHELGYAKNSVSEKNTSNSRNGYSKKTVRSEYGNINLDIPRDRNAEFEPQMIRKLIYTTNPIESLNRQLRKYTKTKSLYPTDEALMKSVYLSLKEATKKWTGRISGWGEIYSQLSIYFEGRI